MSINEITEDELQHAFEQVIKDCISIRNNDEFYFDTAMVPLVLARMLGDYITMCNDPSGTRKAVGKWIDEQIAFRAKTRTSRMKFFTMGYADRHRDWGGGDILERE
jgi:hypothetical protein